MLKRSGYLDDAPRGRAATSAQVHVACCDPPYEGRACGCDATPGGRSTDQVVAPGSRRQGQAPLAVYHESPADGLTPGTCGTEALPAPYDRACGVAISQLVARDADWLLRVPPPPADLRDRDFAYVYDLPDDLEFVPEPCERLRVTSIFAQAPECLAHDDEAAAETACALPPCKCASAWPLSGERFAEADDMISFVHDLLLPPNMLTCGRALLTQGFAAILDSLDIVEYLCCVVFGDRPPLSLPLDIVLPVTACDLLMDRLDGTIPITFHLHSHYGGRVNSIMGATPGGSIIHVYLPFLAGFTTPGVIPGCPGATNPSSLVVATAGTILHEMIHQVLVAPHNDPQCDLANMFEQLFENLANERYNDC